MRFLRKYQKVFLVIVSAMIAIPFLFAGPIANFQQPRVESNREMGTLIDGSLLMEKELRGLIRLTKNGMEEGGHQVNLLNNSLIHREVMLSGLGEEIVKRSFAQIQPQLQERWEKMRRFSPYRHPFASHINAEAAWEQFAPEINRLVEQVKKGPQEITEEQIPLLFALYAAQSEFPPSILHQMLYYQQTQGQAVRPDPALPQANVALFGFQSIEDWLGEDFVELVAKVIFNTAAYGNEKQWTVEQREVLRDLCSNVKKGLAIYMQNTPPSNAQVAEYFTGSLRSIGLTEKEAISLWQKALIFSLVFREAGRDAVVKNMNLLEMKKKAPRSAKVCRYQLPHFMHFNSLRDMFLFQRYIEVACKGDFLNLPTEFRTVAEIMEDHPELAYKVCNASIAKVTKEEVAARTPLRLTWNWQLEEENFAKLEKQFPLLDGKGETREARIAALEGLDERLRFAVDHFSRLALVEEHPHWVKEALAKAPRETHELELQRVVSDEPLAGKKFLKLVEENSPELSYYTTDETTFYAIENAKLEDHWNLYSFERATERGIVDQMLDNLLEAAYPSQEITESFEDAKEEVACLLYKDLIESVRSRAPGVSNDNLPQHRFDPYLHKIRDQLEKNPETATVNPSSPWALKVEEVELGTEVVDVDIGALSAVSAGAFYRVLDRVHSAQTLARLQAEEERIIADAKMALLSSLLEQVEVTHQ